MNIYDLILEYLYKNQNKGFLDISHICSDKEKSTRIARELKKDGLVNFKQKYLLGSGKTPPFRGNPRLEITRLGIEKYQYKDLPLKETDGNINSIMDKNTIQALENLKEGKSVTLTKDSPNEISELISNLKNLGILHKPTRFGYAAEFTNRKYLTKLIELKSWTEFLDWLDGQNTDGNITNDFSGSTVGQVNQSDFLKVEKTEIKQTTQPKTKEMQQNTIFSFIEKFWWQILIPLIIGIILIMIERGVINVGI